MLLLLYFNADLSSVQRGKNKCLKEPTFPVLTKSHLRGPSCSLLNLNSGKDKFCFYSTQEDCDFEANDKRSSEQLLSRQLIHR